MQCDLVRKHLVGLAAAAACLCVGADTRVGCLGQPDSYEMCTGCSCYQPNCRTTDASYFSTMCPETGTYTCLMGDERADGTMDMWPASWDAGSGAFVSCDPNGPDPHDPNEAVTTNAGQDDTANLPPAETTTDNATTTTDDHADDWWATDEWEPEPLPPRLCRRTEGVEATVHTTIEGKGVLCVPIDTAPDKGDVVLSLSPAFDDHDLCVWVDDPEWAADERYADCHGWRHHRLIELHCRSSLGGTDVEQVRVEREDEDEDEAIALMACAVPWQAATGGYTLQIGSAEAETHQP